MKNKKIILIFFIIVIGIIGLMFLGKYTQKTKQFSAVNNEKQVNSNQLNERGNLIAEEKFYDFGEISMVDGKVNKIFQIVNQTGESIKLKSISTSCMCTNAYLLNENGEEIGPFGMEGMGYTPRMNEIIKSGEVRNLKVEFDPNAHGPAGIGKIDRFIDVVDNNGNKLQFEIKAIVKP